MKINYLFLSVFLAFQVMAQDSAYFQQEVNYQIQATLNDQDRTLSGEITIEYTNRAPQAMNRIYMHCWANAFSRANTAYGEQELRTGSTRFYFSDSKDKGYYEGLDFTIDQKPAAWSFNPADPDIALITLDEPLETGRTVRIHTPFILHIPASFSRLGHVGDSFQMTQWYPKPAVLDRKGWHPMPYLDMGEFYADFGNFDVKITLPENYVVGATGTLMTESEKEFLQRKVRETEQLKEEDLQEDDPFPSSSTQMKTLHFIAENVHDFAWFADKRFHVLQEEAVLASGKVVDCWAMFTDEEADIWKKGAFYVKRAVEFYSEQVGEYPWPQATAVHSALSAGGGMEYPMITVIGNSSNAEALDDVITHEVGHNWFYGILASNERDHPWMDEGINTYYEYRYMEQYYGHRVSMDIPSFLTNHSDMDLYELGYLFNARRNLDQAPDLHSDQFTAVNYGTNVYVKTGSVLEHLEQYLGQDVFDRMMKTYYQTWKFRHPYPEDFRKIAETETGKNLSWFFDGYLYSTKKLDYALTGFDRNDQGFVLKIRNKGEIAAPFPVSGMKDGQVVATQWFEGFEGERSVLFPDGTYDSWIVDEGHVTLDINRRNNNFRTKGPGRMEPPRLSFLGPIENSRYAAFNGFPVLGWNEYDGAMLGWGVHNGLLPSRHLEWQAMAMYGFDSKDLLGQGRIQYSIWPATEKIRRITLGMSLKGFNYRSPDSLRTETGYASTHLWYGRLMPFVKIELSRSVRSKFYQSIQFRSILGVEERTDFRPVDTLGVFYSGNSNHGRIINELSWEIGDRRVLNPYSLKLTFEHSEFEDFFQPDQTRRYLRANLEWKGAFTYDQGRRFRVRVFAGGFLKNDYADRGFISNGAYNLTAQGFNDYRWDELYFGRTETEGLLSRQVTEREGGMKIPLGSPYSEGRSNKFIFALNLKSDLPDDLPGKLPLKPYFDLGYYQDNRPISSDLAFEEQLWWQFGFSLEIAQGIFAIHLPVVNSGNVKDLYNQSGRNTFFKRIAFTLDLWKLDPWEIVDKIEF